MYGEQKSKKNDYCPRVYNYSGMEEQMEQKTKIQELERILNSEEETPVRILPNGDIAPANQTSGVDLGAKRPLTMKENLGGEY